MRNNWDRAFSRAEGIVDGGLLGGRSVTRGETVFHALLIDWMVRQMVDWLREFLDIYGHVIKAAELELEELRVGWRRQVNDEVFEDGEKLHYRG